MDFFFIFFSGFKNLRIYWKDGGLEFLMLLVFFGGKGGNGGGGGVSFIRGLWVGGGVISGWGLFDDIS